MSQKQTEIRGSLRTLDFSPQAEFLDGASSNGILEGRFQLSCTRISEMHEHSEF
jgi:hypothetical protein